MHFTTPFLTPYLHWSTRLDVLTFYVLMTSTFQFVKYVSFLNKNKSLMVSYLVSYIHVNVFHIYTIFYVQCYIYYNISFMYFFHFDFFFNCLHTLANFFFLWVLFQWLFSTSPFHGWGRIRGDYSDHVHF